MTAEIPFASALLLTVALLVSVVITGFRARRRLHLTLVACTLLTLVGTIFLALRVGKHYDLEAAGRITPIHLKLARISTYAFLLPIVTGVWTLRRPARRPLHRSAAFLVLTLTVASAVTGTWMLLAAPRLEEPEASGALPELLHEPG